MRLVTWGVDQMSPRNPFFISAIASMCTAGCVSTETLWQEGLMESHRDYKDFGDGLDSDALSVSPSDQSTLDALYEAITLSDITYAENIGASNKKEKRENAARWFAARGYDSLYYNPRVNWFVREPNLFVLGKAKSNHIIIVFHGTEAFDDPTDLFTNIQTKTDDALLDDAQGMYLPSGHRGFRRAALNLLRRGFVSPDMADRSIAEQCSNSANELTFDKDLGHLQTKSTHPTLLNFICAHDIHDENAGPTIDITLIGHSLGSGIAQMSLGFFDGLMAPQNAEAEPTEVSRKEHWPFRVRQAFLFAPPLALHTRSNGECERNTQNNPVDIYRREELTSRTHMIIRQGDMIPFLWNPLNAFGVHCVQGEHFGHLVDIDRSGNVSLMGEVDWKLREPHHSASYRSALATATGHALNDERITNGDDVDQTSPHVP